ncbi:MAG: type I polyketide synthase, partial [bacterium]|nr:type I polyketide synthase [bacterium]
GHLDAAAEVAGFIKTVLALKNRQIPPSLHYETPNPEIDFENSPFYVNTTLKQWKNNSYPPRAGVSSFGIGGTNVHVVLEEWPGNDRPDHCRDAIYRVRDNENSGTESTGNHLILLSAKTETALEKMSGNLTEYFKKNPGADLADAAYTLQLGRKAFEYRKMLTAANVQEVIRNLQKQRDTAADRKVHTSFCSREKKPRFMFAGLGSQY